jgi:hypothetical protein
MLNSVPRVYRHRCQLRGSKLDVFVSICYDLQYFNISQSLDIQPEVVLERVELAYISRQRHVHLIKLTLITLTPRRNSLIAAVLASRCLAQALSQR